MFWFSALTISLHVSSIWNIILSSLLYPNYSFALFCTVTCPISVLSFCSTQVFLSSSFYVTARRVFKLHFFPSLYSLGAQRSKGIKSCPFETYLRRTVLSDEQTLYEHCEDSFEHPHFSGTVQWKRSNPHNPYQFCTRKSTRWREVWSAVRTAKWSAVSPGS